MNNSSIKSKNILYITTSDLSKNVGGSVYSRSNIKILSEIFSVKVFSNTYFRYINNRLINKIISFLLYLVNKIPPHINYHSHKLLLNYNLLKRELNFKYDYIILENLQLFHLLKIIQQPVIYVSQNIESNLVEMRYPNLPHFVKNKLKKSTKRLEYEFSRLSKGIISISIEETYKYKKYNKNCITLPPTFPKKEDLKQTSSNDLKIFGFLGTRHWLPNIIAFNELFTNVIPKIRLKCKICIVGNGWNSLYQNLNVPNNPNVTLEFLGYVESLSSFWTSIDALLAPVSSGAGINIKVCESIANNVKVIGFDNAFRGLPEDVKSLNYIVHNFSQFALYINEYRNYDIGNYTDYFNFNKNCELVRNWFIKNER